MLQERLVVSDAALGFGGDWQFVVGDIGKVARPPEPARVAVNLFAGLNEQLQKGRVRSLARDERGGRRDQPDILRRNITRQVDHPARQHRRSQKREAPRISVALREIHQPHAGRLQQHLHHQRFRRRGKHDGVELALQEGHGRRGLLKL